MDLHSVRGQKGDIIMNKDCQHEFEYSEFLKKYVCKKCHLPINWIKPYSQGKTGPDPRPARPDEKGPIGPFKEPLQGKKGDKGF